MKKNYEYKPKYDKYEHYYPSDLQWLLMGLGTAAVALSSLFYGISQLHF